VTSAGNRELNPAAMFLGFCRKARVEQVELGIYNYAPQSIADERRIVRISANNFWKKFAALREKLSEHEDIAVHSRVSTTIAGHKRWLHVPMIDLRNDLKDSDVDELIKAARDFGAKEVAIYFSGRSFHVYAYTLLPMRRWTAFMGRCLLLNRADEPELVDARWVGHRLLAGYGALRWTRQSKWYHSEPVYKVGFDVPSSGTESRLSDALRRVEYVQPWLF
jgi:hypothetical protein